jgi:hypothetical protein
LNLEAAPEALRFVHTTRTEGACASSSVALYNAIYGVDRAYLDFQRLYQLHQCSAIFVTRSKTNTGLRRIYSNTVDKSTGVACGQVVVVTGYCSKKDYPESGHY